MARQRSRGHFRAGASRVLAATLSRLAERDRLRAFPEALDAQRTQVLVALDDRREVIARERSGLAPERHVAVGDQQLGLAHAARIEDDLARARILRRVLRPETEVEVAHRDP